MTILLKLVRIAWGFIVRLLKCLKELLVWIDLGVGLIISIPLYILFGRPVPCATMTISNIVGYYAEHDYKWALAAEWFIDRLFYVFEGFRLGHCRRKFETDDIDWEDIHNYQ